MNKLLKKYYKEKEESYVTEYFKLKKYSKKYDELLDIDMKRQFHTGEINVGYREYLMTMIAQFELGKEQTLEKINHYRKKLGLSLLTDKSFITVYY